METTVPEQMGNMHRTKPLEKLSRKYIGIMYILDKASMVELNQAQGQARCSSNSVQKFGL